jgi:hypothetical protein
MELSGEVNMKEPFLPRRHIAAFNQICDHGGRTPRVAGQA